MSIIKTIRTIRYLKAAQVTGQIRYRLRPCWERPDRFFQMPVPDPDECGWRHSIAFLAPGAQASDADAIEAGRFTFLNREENLGWPPPDWNVPGLPKLWQYNRHYFEWLWALDFPEARTAILDWIARHPLARGSVGWEPYPTSLRLMNWCAVCYGKFRDQTEQDKNFERDLWRSLFLQTEWLSQHIETHLLGNHLFENGAALAFVGSCFSRGIGQLWLAKGIAILCREIREQILPDGMHFERSPMYHVRMTYLLRLLLDTGTAELKNLVATSLPRMQQALACLCHADGGIALLNDSAFSIYNEPCDLLGSESRGTLGAWALPDAGYYGYRGADGSYIVCDAGPIGPDYLPGHAHGDIFSFELSFRGMRVVVDSGVYDYEPNAMRRYCRSTRAHNTVEIDGQDQCEFWGAFRVARRGYPRDIRWEPASDGFRLSGQHDGYRRLPGSPNHQRTFVWDRLTGLAIQDRVTAGRKVDVVSRIHLHPDCRILRLGECDAEVQFSGGVVLFTFSGPRILSQEDSFYNSVFGTRCENKCLCLTMQGMDMSFGCRISVRE